MAVGSCTKISVGSCTKIAVGSCTKMSVGSCTKIALRKVGGSMVVLSCKYVLLI